MTVDRKSVVALLFALTLTGCQSSRNIEGFCKSVRAQDDLAIVRARAASAGGVVKDFAQTSGFLLYQRDGVILGTAMCQVDAKDGRVTRVDFFVD